MTPMAYRNSTTATAPEAAASTFRHRGSFGGFQSAEFSCGSGRGGMSSGRAGSGGRTPPQAEITSSAVTASGLRLRAMRLAEVV